MENKENNFFADIIKVQLQNLVKRAHGVIDYKYNERDMTFAVERFLNNYAWLVDENAESPLSFEQLCEFLDLDRKSIRTQVLKDNPIIREAFEVAVHKKELETEHTMLYTLNISGKQFADILRGYKESNDLSWADIGKKYRMNTSTLSEWVRYQKVPTDSNLIRKLLAFLPLESYVELRERKRRNNYL